MCKKIGSLVLYFRSSEVLLLLPQRYSGFQFFLSKKTTMLFQNWLLGPQVVKQIISSKEGLHIVIDKCFCAL